VIVVAVVPLNLTVLGPWVAPKLVPLIVTATPAAPEVGDKLVMLGAATTVKLLPLEATPLTVTTTFPVVAPVGTVVTIEVALQLVAVAVVPLNFTVLVPCVVPNPVPVMVTDAPTAPEAGDSVVMLGAANAQALRTRHERTSWTIRRMFQVTLVPLNVNIQVAEASGLNIDRTTHLDRRGRLRIRDGDGFHSSRARGSQSSSLIVIGVRLKDFAI